ncbi:MAG: DNA mismatch repair protein MutL [Gammaproteobacteria bacterium HGW-Gammaproteobacteria-1]|jgi:DNA mismatch repair protein MutL|nr:MAG: DNA mismatch repair protein MutL [Gammaproteobacteria bacterium HGW-Gammaproteobacteria-1]
MTSVPRRIRQLDLLLANQIAAGEVVERPASVMKELLENSLDAGAAAITVEVEQGGVALIRVRDDGSGIAAADLPLALARHATSKVYSQDELVRVMSLGFRGEALASISSVSRLILSSRSAAEEHGCRISGQGAPAPCAHPRGTTVEVRDLFYNTPARRKFLRAERTEFEHLAEVAKRVALSRFDVALTLHHNQRQVLAVRPAHDDRQREQRLAAICGRPFVQQAVAVEFTLPGLRLWGWLLRPEAARAQADMQYFFINGRAIRDRVVTHAVRQAYGDKVYPGRHPAYVLYLEMDPAQVDVNVHPTKHEVRFRETRQVHDFLYRALRAAVDEAAAAPSGTLAVREATAAYQSAATDAGATGTATRQLGVVAGRYLLVDEGERGLRLVDLPAARALQASRVAHATLTAGENLRSQPLLLPVTLSLSAAQSVALQQGAALLTRLGFDLELLGPLQLVLRQVPALLRHLPPEVLARTALDSLAAGADTDALVAALVVVDGGPLPERGEWDGLVAAAVAHPTAGVSTLLAPADLARLLAG